MGAVMHETDEIRVLDHGFVRLDGCMADDLSVVNGARVSFAQRVEEMTDREAGLIRFLMRERHGSPFEHNAFRFHIKVPIFVMREWARHRIGCLTGDTEVTFVNTNGQTGPGLRKTIDELWRMWYHGEIDGHAPDPGSVHIAEALIASGGSLRAAERSSGISRHTVARRSVSGRPFGIRRADWRVRAMNLRVLNEETGEFGVGHICDVVNKGLQPVYELTLADGKKLTLTENHRVLTTDGWATMGSAVGLSGDPETPVMRQECSLMVNGLPAHQDRTWMAERRREGLSIAGIAAEANCSFHTVRKWLRIHSLQFSEAERSFQPGHVPWNKDKPGYTTQYAVPPPPRGYKLIAHAVRVTAIRYVGLRQTYDLSVEGPWHNFVANGVVVHNSFNEWSGRYSQLEPEFYVPEPEDVRTQVGKPGSYSFETVGPELAEHTREAQEAVFAEAYRAYEDLLERGVAKEIARNVLPVAIYTQFYWTVNARSLMNFLSLRNSETAQREIRRYAAAVEELFATRMPITHAAFVANDRRAP
jgi:thymidylate synthase ThyX